MDHLDGQLGVIAPLGCDGFKNKRSNRNRTHRISPSTNVINESPKGLHCSHSSILMGRYEESELKSLSSVIYQSTDLTLLTQTASATLDQSPGTPTALHLYPLLSAFSLENSIFLKDPFRVSRVSESGVNITPL